ncbi:hypothetical protein [Dyadobacter sp. Leaf189]|uniref:hypothetical protein n=1 Tax=Dyadobacter sp. Leaf189 TaxID=1736295 RepID=UPI0006F68683|nr:hypothetical protein [Dyadobacter sp. Leaf189]KQS27060.1 hypothetical protein ASG33_21240 [Dyadobacter sp. Leaf189]
MFRIILIGFGLMMGIWILQACNQTKVKMSNSLEHVKEVFHQDKQEIIGKYNATGAGIGKEGEEYVIVVYLRGPGREEKTEQWKTVKLKLKYTGEMKAL